MNWIYIPVWILAFISGFFWGRVVEMRSHRKFMDKMTRQTNELKDLIDKTFGPINKLVGEDKNVNN